MQSLRSLREQAERVAVAEVKTQREVECETIGLREKVASQAQIISELSEQLAAYQRKPDGGSAESPACVPLVPAEDDTSMATVVDDLKAHVAALEARLQAAGKVQINPQLCTRRL